MNSAVLLADTSNSSNAAVGFAIIGVFLAVIALLVIYLIRASNRATRVEGELHRLMYENQQLRHSLGLPAHGAAAMYGWGPAYPGAPAYGPGPGYPPGTYPPASPYHPAPPPGGWAPPSDSGGAPPQPPPPESGWPSNS